VANSPANPLPTAFYGREIPLPADSIKSRHAVDLDKIFGIETALFWG